MVGLNTKVGEEKGLAAGTLTAAVRLDCDKYCINLGQCLGVIGLHNPTLLVRVVLIEDTEIHGVIAIRSSAPPSLECACALDARLLIEIVGIKDERFPTGIEDPPKGFLRISGLCDVVDLSDIEIARAHQFSDVAVVIQQLLLAGDFLIALALRCRKLVNFLFKRCRVSTVQRILIPN